MVSIRTKFIFCITLLFILIGALIYIPLSNILPQKVTAQILKRDAKVAEYLANTLKEYLLLNDRLSLSLLLEDNLNKLEDVQYLFIQAADGEIISHTFNKSFPRGLLGLNSGREHPYKIKAFLNEDKKFYDIAIPILKGELGYLHMGVSLDSSKAEIASFSQINYYIALVIFIGLGIGILIFTLLGVFLSNRIIKLKEFSIKIGKGDLDSRININSNDEIGSLATSFNQMAADLKEKIEEIKKLSYLEERNRIAIEFHDNLAQDLANIIKRLELCERLFKVDEIKALGELSHLRENTKDILNRTRRLIFDLKSPGDTDFNLWQSLDNYLKDYQVHNEIKVKLEILGSRPCILGDKARQIFYIISEALTNVRKHSLAENVELTLGCNDGNLSIKIEDDGKGFELKGVNSKEGLGLVSMRQRANSLEGRFSLDSKHNQGTRIWVDIPI